MSCESRLNRSFENAPVLPLTPSSRYVLFSDCHRGNGTHNDNFLKNQHLYFAALRYYYRNQFTYIELGDGDELWENRDMEQIKEIHSNVFWQLSCFYQKNRLYMIYGNHDMVKKYPQYVRKKCDKYFCTKSQCDKTLFPELKHHAGIILRTKEGRTIYLTHGHQASFMNSTLWRVNCFLVRYLWKPLEHIGILDPTSAAKNYTTKRRSEEKLIDWARKHPDILITGHTHRPRMDLSEEPYLNSGSCIHPRCVTCIEIVGEKLFLVKWYMSTREDGAFFLERAELATGYLPN